MNVKAYKFNYINKSNRSVPINDDLNRIRLLRKNYERKIILFFVFKKKAIKIGFNIFFFLPQEKANLGSNENLDSLDSTQQDNLDREETQRGGLVALNRSKSINRQRLVAHSTAMESIQAESEPIDQQDDIP